MASVESGLAQLSKTDEYKSQAAECLRLAHEVSDKTSKALFLTMAQAWLRLREHAKDHDSRDRLA